MQRVLVAAQLSRYAAFSYRWGRKLSFICRVVENQYQEIKFHMQPKKPLEGSTKISACLVALISPVFISPQSIAVTQLSSFNLEVHNQSRLLVARELRSSEVTVDALAAISNSDGKLVGGAAESIKIRIERGRGPSVGIAFFESELNTIRTGMRSSAWLAITSSSLLLGDSLGEYNFSFDAEGSNLDGPSAGGLFTVAVLSLLRGDKIRSDATMTGTGATST